MPEKIKTLYSNLIQEGYDLPNYDQFLLDMSDSNKRKKFHSSLIEEGYDLPDFNTFTIDMGIGEKKKPTSVGLPRAFQPFQEGVGQSVKMPSPSTSTSTSTKTPTTTTPKVSKLSEFNKKYGTNYTAKQIQGKEPVIVKPEDESFVSELYESAKRGSAMLGSMLASTPSFMYDIAAYPQNKLAELTGLPIGTSSEQIAQTLGLPENEIANYYKQIVKEGQAKVQQKYDKGVSEYLFGDKPDYTKGFKLLANQVVESAPISLSMMMGSVSGIGPLASTLGGGVVFGSENMNELEDSNLSEAAKVENALTKGLFEGIFEQFGITKLGGVVSNVFKEQGKDAALEIAKKGFRETYYPALKKYIGIGAEESIGEAATQYAQNMVSILSGEKPDLDPMDGVLDAAIVGLGSSAAFSTPTAVFETLALSKKRKEAREKQDKIQKIEEAIANPETTPEAKAVLSDMSKTLNEEVSDIYEEAKADYEALPDEKKQELVEVLSKKEELEIAANDTSIDETIKEDISTQIKELDNKVEAISKEARISALERLKVAEQEITPQEPKIQEDEKITAKEENVEPMLAQPQNDRDEVKGGEASAELRTDQEEEVKPKEESVSESKDNPALKDVESTAKALEGADKKFILSKLKKFSLDSIDEFYHASSIKRKGRLKKSNAEGFGTGVYFSTNKDLVTDEFGENVTNVALLLNNPVFTNTNEYYNVVKLAIETADKDYGEKRNLTLEEDETFFRYDPENFSEIYEIPSYYLSNAAEKLGHDAIIDKNSSSYDNEIVVLDDSKIVYEEDLPKVISEAYHKAKEDGSNPELVQAVEQLLTNKPQEDAIKSGKIEQSSESERKGVTEQKQGEQEDRVNQEEPITKGQASPSGSDFVSEGGEKQEVIDELDLLSPELKEVFKSLENRKPKKSKAKPKDNKFTEAIEFLKEKNPVANGMLRATYNRIKIEPFLNDIGKEILKSDASNIAVAEILQKYIEKAEQKESDIIQRLENLKADTKGKMNAFGIAPAVWNAAIDTIILGVKAGRVISEVVQEAIDYINANHGKFDEKAFKDMLVEGGVVTEDELVVEGEPNIEETAKKSGISVKNLSDLYNVNRELFGLDRVKSLASAIAMDRMIGAMAKRAGVTKAEMYGKLKFEKASEKDLPQGVKMQVDAWHGSPYEFDKFTTEKIGTGEGAQAFGWGLYFTDLESIARNYAEKLAKANSTELLKKTFYTYNELKERFKNLAQQEFLFLEAMSFSGEQNGIDYYNPFNPSLPKDPFQKGINSSAYIFFKKQLDGINFAISELKEDFSEDFKEQVFKKYNVNSFEELNNSQKRIEKIYNELNSILNSNRNIYKVSLHKGKSPDQYTWLIFDKPVSENIKEKLIEKIEKENSNPETTPFTSSTSFLVEKINSAKTGGDLYSILSGLIYGDKNASLFLLDAGIDGIKYPAESISRGATSDTARGFNYVVFDENAVSIEEVIKFQKDAEKARGAMMIGMDGQAVIYALTDPNVSTPLHELAHVFEHYLTDEERKTIIRNAGTKGWTIETSEYFARGFEKYLAEGKSPIESLNRIFEKFKAWLTEIYNGIINSDIDIELNDEMRSIYAKVLGFEPSSKKDTERKPKQGSTPNSRVRSHYTTVTDNKTLSNITDELDSLEYEYEVKPEKSDKETAIAYIEQYGVEESYQNVIDNTYNEELAGSEANALASLVYGALSKAMALAIKEGDMAAADLIKERSKELIKKVSERGTDAGRFVNSFKYFALDFSNPETAAYNLQKEVEEINKKTREKSSNISNANSVAKDIAKEVKKGKAKVVSEVVKDIDEMLYGTITKGKKGLTPEQKAKVKSVFEAFKVNKDGKVQSSVVPIKEIIAAIVTPEKYNQFIDKVADAVAEGVSLSVAMTRVSAEFIKNNIATPKEMAAARKALTEQVNGIKTKKPLTEKQIERRKASEELKAATERFNALNELEKFREKQEKRVEDLRKKDAQKVLDEVEKLELQRSRKLAKEAASLEEELRKEKQRIADLKAKEEITRKEKLEKLALQRAQKEAKEAKDLEEEIRKENKRIADLRAKEEIERREKIEKLELQRAQERLKQIERTIRDLVLGIPKTDEELVNEIITEYLSLEGDAKTKNEKLVKLVKDNIEGLTDSEARVIATKIAKGVAEKIKKKLETKFGSALSKEEQEQKKVSATPKTKEDILDQLVKASNLGVASPQLIMDFFQNKYGIQNLSAEDVNGIIELSKALANAPTKNRKGVILAEIQKVIDSKKKRTLAELLQNLWYARVLSPVLTGVLGTGDVNLAYNILAVKLNMIEAPLTASINSMKYIVKDIKGNIVDKRKVGESIKQNLLGLLTDSLSASLAPFVQRVNYDADANLFKTIIKNPTLLRESITYFTESLSNGLAFKKDTENPFTATGASTFNISNYLKYFEDARKGDKKAKAIIGMAVNKYVNSVTNMLGGQDLAFGTMVGRGYMSTLVREKLYKEGLRGKELNSKVLETILDTKIQGELAAEKALSYRMNFDISIDLQMDNDGNTYYIIKDKGKVYKERFKYVEKRFDSKDEAIDYAREVVAPKSNTFRLDVINILNERLGEDVLKNMNRISSNDLLSAQAEGSARLVFSMATFIIDNLNKLSDAFNDMSKNLDTYDWKDILGMAKEKDIDAVKGIIRKVLKYITKTISILVRSTANLLAFLRVGLNSVRNQSSYIFPIGVLRYFASYFSDDKGRTRTILSTMSYEMSDTEKSKILAKAMIGAYTFSATAYLSTFLTANADDDDEDKETLEERERARELFRSWYKEKTGKDLPRNIDDFYFKLTKGDVIGSLNWLTPEEYKFYKKTGLFPENSIFLGFDSKGKPIFESILNDPSYAMAVSASTYKLIQAFGDEEQKEMAKINAAITPFYSWKDMTIGSGGISVLLGNKKPQEKMETIVQVSVLDNLEVLSPRIIPVTLQYFYPEARRTDNLFEAIERQESVVKGSGQFFIQRVFPLTAGWYQSTQAPKMYGMLGETIVRVPAEKQGLFSAYYAKLLRESLSEDDSDLSKAISKKLNEWYNTNQTIDESKLYIWMAANGKRTSFKPPVEQAIVNGDGEIEKLTMSQKEKYEPKAALKSKEFLLKNLYKLQILREVGGETTEDKEKAFSTEIQKIFKQNFLNEYYLGEKSFGDKTAEMVAASVNNMQTKLDEKVNSAIIEYIKRTEKNKDIKITPEEEEMVSKGYTAEQYLAFIKDDEDKMGKLERARLVGILTQEQFMKSLEMLGKFKSKSGLDDYLKNNKPF